MIKSDSKVDENMETPIEKKRDVNKWVNTTTDKYIVNVIKNDLSLKFKFLDNTCLEGKVKWFNKYTLGVVAPDGFDYVLLKHSLKYMESIS